MTSYLPFFSGTATVAGALVGLLFVALSVAPERLRGAHASVEHQAIAATAFTALVDALFVSLIGLQPPVPEPAPDGNEQAGSRAVTKPVRAHCSCRDSMLVVHRCFPITPPPRS